MRNRYIIIILILGLLAAGLFTGYAVQRNAESTPTFPSGGFFLHTVEEQKASVSFSQGTAYSTTLAGAVSFTSTDQGKVTLSRQSYAHLDNQSTMALSDGVLLDLNDLSENFINNYYIPAGLAISHANDTFSAQTTAGAIQFGEHIWKLADSLYLIRSSALTVHLDGGARGEEAGKFVQVHITADSVVHILSPEGLWMTISPDCYIRTAEGVKIYPVSLLVDNGVYKLSMAKLAVSTDDAIVLTEDETRRQIVPELKIEAIDGEDGKDGSEGAGGSDGQSGQDGKKGDPGVNALPGSDGADADSQSTIRTVIPTMTITDWQMDTDTLKGTIKVNDPSGFLNNMSGVTNWQTLYPCKITITEKATGKVIQCHMLDDNGGAVDCDFYSTQESYKFATADNALQPNTEYTLTVTASYRTTSPEMIYTREFLNRNFVTDASGITLFRGDATTESVSVSAALSGGHNISKAVVYLLTPEQAKTFTANSINNPKTYVASQEIDLKNPGTALSFAKLTPNTGYVARVHVVLETGLQTLTNQSLSLETLKRLPTWTGQTSATFNRYTGKFEARRPVTNDPDNGIVNYFYIVYDKDKKELFRQTVSPSAGEPVVFSLETGKEYYFGVEAEFNDNSKTTLFDMGMTQQPIQALGSILPAVRLKNDGSIGYNYVKDTILVSLFEDTTLTIDDSHPLTLKFYADTISLNQEFRFTNSAGESKNFRSEDDPSQGQITLNADQASENYRTISLDLKNLSRNTTYAITVFGYVDLFDGNGLVQQELGTVSFHTTETATLTAHWNPTENTEDSFSRMLNLTVNTGENQVTQAVAAYTLGQLKNGRMIVELFSGAGASKTSLGTFNMTGADLEAALGSGYELTNRTFDRGALDSNGSYTIEITSLADTTYNMDLPYVNTFQVVWKETPIAATPTPPALPDNPYGAIQTTVITNANASSYGLGPIVDKSLPDDTVLGYALDSTYYNSPRVGVNITYYAFEFNTYMSTLLNNQDPVDIARKGGNNCLVKTKKLGFNSKEKAPGVIILFGAEPAGSGIPESYNNYSIVWAGDAQTSVDAASGAVTLTSGMGRGFRYIFAYTVEYAQNLDLLPEYKTYPYDMGTKYTNFCESHGGFSITGDPKDAIGGKYYILSSGMMEAPLVLPKFYTLVNRSEDTGLHLYYAWKDYENVIKPDATLTTNNRGGTQPLIHTGADGQTNAVAGTANPTWYQADIFPGGTTEFQPEVSMSRYIADYSSVLSQLKVPADPSTQRMTRLVMDSVREWETQDLKALKIEVEADTSALNKNVLRLRFVHPVAGPQSTDAEKNAAREAAQALKTLMSRSSGARVTLSDGTNTQTLSLALEYDDANRDSPYQVSIPTGNLLDFLNAQTKVTKVELFYDTGRQGWHYATHQDGQEGTAGERFYAIQTVRGVTPQGENTALTLSGYFGGSNNTILRANRSANKTSQDFSSVTQLTSLVQLDESQGLTFGTYSLPNRGVFGSTNGVAKLHPTYLGMYHSDRTLEEVRKLIAQNDAAGKGYNVVVPKEIKTVEVPAKDQDFSITQITPSVNPNVYFEPTPSKISLSNILIRGMPQGGTIKIADYADWAEAEALEDTALHTKTVTIGPADGNGISRPAGEPVVFDGLAAGSTHIFAFYYEPVPGGEKILLMMNDGTGDQAIFGPKRTVSGANVKVISHKYTNESYFGKSLEFSFRVEDDNNVTLLHGLKLTYAIYNTEDWVNSQPILTHQQMMDDNLINPPGSLLNTNLLTLNLAPSIRRQALVPGGSYYLRFSIADEADPDKEIGYLHYPFTIAPATQLGSPIRVASVSKSLDESDPKNHVERPVITYEVTINDSQHSFMGANGTSSVTDKGGLYAVRFTDSNGRRISTIYDKELYSTKLDTPKKTFVLDAGTDPQKATVLPDSRQYVNFGETYTLHVFALPDVTHNGQIQLDYPDAGNQTKLWSDFFKDNQDLAQGAALSSLDNGFQAYVDKLWNDTFSAWRDGMAESRDLIQVGSKSQNAGEKDQPIVNTGFIDGKLLSGGKLRIEFYDSFNLVTKDGVQAYNQIDVNIVGTSNQQKPVYLDMTLRAGTHDLIQSGTDSYGDPIQYLEIDAGIPAGSYPVVLQFRKNIGDPAPAFTHSMRISG